MYIGVLLVQGESKIERCIARRHGGGVYFTGTFRMDGSIISDCVSVRGGALYVEQSSTATMARSVVAGCAASLGGNDVYFLSPLQLIIATNVTFR